METDSPAALAAADTREASEVLGRRSVRATPGVPEPLLDSLAVAAVLAVPQGLQPPRLAAVLAGLARPRTSPDRHMRAAVAVGRQAAGTSRLVALVVAAEVALPQARLRVVREPQTLAVVVAAVRQMLQVAAVARELL
jgi:hypothetical protein